jgi:hypothetical protein
VTKISFVAAVSALALVGACAQPGTSTPADAAAPVPAGCEPNVELMTWSPPRDTPILTEATLLRAGEASAGAAGTPLPSRPFTPSITDVAAPASWLPALAGSLSAHLGRPVHATTPSAEGQSFGVTSGSGQADLVLYTGVDQVSADFDVRCSPGSPGKAASGDVPATVHGTFHAWSRVVPGGVSCEYTPPAELDPFGRLALKLCPAQPTSPPSTPVEAGEFTPDQPGT